MHGVTMKIIEAQQAKLCNIYKNTRLKLLKTKCISWTRKGLISLMHGVTVKIIEVQQAP